MQQQKFEIDKSLFPFESKWMEMGNGSKLHYIDEGEGPVLLLLHGNPTWSFLYRKMIPGLRDNYRCIAPDYPGFGLSTAPDDYEYTVPEHTEIILEFISKLDLNNINIFLQDWAGPIGLAIAQRVPDRINGFIIGNTWGWPQKRFAAKMFSKVMGGPIGKAAAWSFNGIVHMFMIMGLVHKLDKKALNMYLAPFAKRKDRAPTHIFPKEILASTPFLAEVYKQMPLIQEKPALLVWGKKDFAFQQREKKMFENIFSNHKTVMLPNAGHFVQEDAPDEIVEAIKAWQHI